MGLRAWARLGVAVLVVSSVGTSAVFAAGAGQLDRTFDGDGVVTTDLGGREWGHGVAIQPDGKIVIAGEALPPAVRGNTDNFGLARYLPDGSLDPTFGSGGTVTTTFGNAGFAAATDVAIQPDGKIVAGGTSRESSGGDVFALVRYLPDGTLDTAFSGDGRASASISGDAGDPEADAFAKGLALAPDGKIVIAGDARMPTVGGVLDSDLAFARFTSSGELDTTFDADGVQVIGLDDAEQKVDSVEDVVVQSGGRILGGGYTGAAPTGQTLQMVVVGLTDAGALDPTFGQAAGSTLIDAGPDADYASDIDLQGDGKIVLAGRARKPEGGFDFAFARLTSNGSLDPSFGTGGTVVYGETSPTMTEQARAVAIQADGKIVGVGGSGVLQEANSANGVDTAVIRLHANGSIDQSFDGGVAIHAVNPNYEDVANDVAIDAAGDIVTTGYAVKGAEAAPDRDWSTLRFLAEGDDPSTTLTLNVQKTRRKIVAAGSLRPEHPGFNMIVRLYKRNDGRFRPIGKKTPSLSNDSEYRAVFSRPGAGSCKVVAEFVGDGDHTPAKKSKAFRC